jgi:RecA/RadA recombinase
LHLPLAHCSERFTSGCLTLDKALGGGYPKGRIVEIFGPEASGKTTLALHAIAEVQKAGGYACFIDAEHAFDASYAQVMTTPAPKPLPTPTNFKPPKPLNVMTAASSVWGVWCYTRCIYHHAVLVVAPRSVVTAHECFLRSHICFLVGT